MYPTPTRAAAAIDSAVVREAARVAALAVETVVANARHAAERCGCAGCRVRATETGLWALALAPRRPDDTLASAAEPAAWAA